MFVVTFPLFLYCRFLRLSQLPWLPVQRTHRIMRWPGSVWRNWPSISNPSATPEVLEHTCLLLLLSVRPLLPSINNAYRTMSSIKGTKYFVISIHLWHHNVKILDWNSDRDISDRKIWFRIWPVFCYRVYCYQISSKSANQFCLFLETC